MNKTTKGALAAGGAAAVLIGGVGSLAYWTTGSTVNAGSFTSGSLRLTAQNVAGTSSPCDANWVYANGSKAGTTVVTIVPGDAITKTCYFTVQAVGDHLTAAPTVPPTVTYTTTGGTPSTLSLPVTATYKNNGAGFTSGSTITSADNGHTLTAAIVVTFPFGTTMINGNDTEGLTHTLDGLTVSLQQTQATSTATPTAANPNN